MAWELLKTDYVDAVFEGLRRYLVSDNGDGTVSFHDVTNYTVKEESFFGAKDANTINTAVNAILAALEDGTDLYEVFTQFFEAQKELFQEESDAKQDGFEAYITELRAYMDGKWDELKAEYTGDIQYFKDVQENAFNVWFQMIRDQLTNDVAGHLQIQIGNLEDLKTDEKEDLVKVINSLPLSYDETMGILMDLKSSTVNVTLSAEYDWTNTEGQTVTLLNVDTGEEVFKDYEEGGISFEVFGGMEYRLSVSDMEYYATPDAVDILIEKGLEDEGLEVQFVYKYKSLNELPWQKIIELSEDGKANEVFDIHDEKEIKLTTGEKIVVEIVGFDHDILTADTEKTAGITFGMKDCLNTSYSMNSTDTNVGGWKESEMRTIHIKQRFYNVLPEEIKAGIKTVNKMTSSYLYSMYGAPAVEVTEDDVWLFSVSELGSIPGGYYYNQEGSEYPAFSSKESRIKHRDNNIYGGLMIANYLLRSPHQDASNSYFFYVDEYGNAVSSGKASYKYGIAVGFCV